MRSLVFGLLMVLCVGVAHADVPYEIYGAGTESCGTYVTEPHGSGAKLLDVQWVLGYISPIGLWQSLENHKLADTDANAMEVWVNNYCQAHPLDTLQGAVDALGLALTKRGMQQQ
jgi:hypothetical protein